MINRSLLLLSAVVGLITVVLKSFSKHDEAAMLSDWSNPPPLPVFVAVVSLASSLRALADMLTPPPIKMIDIALAYHTTMLAYLCQKHKIPDFLATGPKTIAEIAEHMQTKDVDRVERVLYAMAAEGITKLDKDSPDKLAPRFVNSALSATMRSDHPNCVSAFVGHNVEDLWNVWGSLPDLFGPNSIDSAWDHAWPDYTKEKGGIWAFFEADNRRELQFGRAMFAIEGLGGRAMASDGPFAKFSRIIDVGGSLGHFAYKVLTENPQMTGVLYDRAHVVDNAKKLWYESDGIYHDGTEQRLEVVAGDFFQEKNGLPEARDGDVYHLRYILHDWNDEDCLVILKALKEKMGGKKAALAIGESAMPDRQKIGVPPAVHHVDIQMMVCCGAKERTPTMWKELLGKAGFTIVAIHPTRSMVHYVEAVAV